MPCRGRGAALADNRPFLLWVSLAMLLAAVVLNIIGLNIGKWLQNAGGVGTYLPLLILAGVAMVVCRAARLGNPFHACQHVAHVELGHGELLVADRVCLHRARARFLHGRGGA